MAENPKILVVSPTFPYPLISGGKIRIYYILKQLSSDFRITLLSLAEPGDGIEHSGKPLGFLDEIILVPIKQDKFSQLLRILVNLHRWLSGTPLEVLVKQSSQMNRTLKSLLQTKTFKAVQVEYTQGMQFLDETVGMDTPVIFVAHDVSFVSQQRKADVLCGFAHFFWKAEAEKMRIYEHKVWKRSDRIAAMSETDRQKILQIIPEADIDVVPNGVEIRAHLKKNEEEIPTIVFAGWMRHLPNRDAISWFIKSIWPKIIQKKPNLCLKIIGRGVPESILTASEEDSRIQVLGFVDDIEKIISSAWLSVVPIRIGSGSRLKILESMALKTPVVSTTIGCEGLNVTKGENIEIADSPDDFAHAVLDLIGDRQSRQKLSDNGENLVGKYYAWDKIGQAAKRVIENVL